MDKIIEEVTGVLRANGGEMIYKPLYEAVSQNAQRSLYPALRNMKRAKLVTLVNQVDPDTHRTDFTITLV